MRAIPLEKRAGTLQRWALALQTFGLRRGAAIIESSPMLRWAIR